MRVSVLITATAAFLSFASTVPAADYTGFWKRDCADPFGVSIKPDVDKMYSISFCTPVACSKWRPNTRVDGDPLYRAIDAETLDARAAETEPWQRWKKCTTETNPKLEWPTAQAQAQARPSPPAPAQAQPGTPVQAQPGTPVQTQLPPLTRAQPNPGDAVAKLNPAWVGTWKSQDGTATITISATQMVRTSLEDDGYGKKHRMTREFKWSEMIDSDEGREFGYSNDRTSPTQISKRYEAAVRQFRKDPTDFVISNPKASRQALAAISPGVYRILWSYWGGDCMGWEYILDGDRMLEVSECKYGFDVGLYNRVSAR